MTGTGQMLPRKTRTGQTRRVLLAGAVAACATAPQTATRRPLVIAHRGASGERPEHTLNAYRLAIAQGADFIEPDLVLTKDGVLVCRHENEISGTTDVADRAEFAARRTTKTIDGEAITGWFTEDFTLSELKQLRCRERLPQLRPQNVAWNGNGPIPTFREVCALAHEFGVGVYPETKHAGYFDSLGLAHDAPLLATLSAFGFNRRSARVFIQSFEVANLQRLRGKTRAPLVQLASRDGGPADRPGASFAALLADLPAVARYADAIGVEKTLIVPRDAAGRSMAPTDLVARAHAAGLKVHAWTFRAENTFLPAELRAGADPAAHGDLASELHQYFALGVDGVFCDFPALAVAARG